MKPPDDLQVALFETQALWQEWLAKNYGQTDGLWLKISKKASGLPSVTYAEALEDALCYGWIDGQKRVYDDAYYLQKFTPRRPKSIWSKVNVDKIAGLSAAGKMKPSGLAAVASAKQDGRWDRAYDSHSTITVPDDFQKALDADERAKQFFDSLNKTNRYAILWRLQTTHKTEARTRKIEQFIVLLHNNETLY